LSTSLVTVHLRLPTWFSQKTFNRISATRNLSWYIRFSCTWKGGWSFISGSCEGLR
jgi:hypothetical protein